jgi:topoisomerase-4 subunit B
VRDFGRGIPLGKVVDCVSKINTGAKYNDDVFQFSVGLNGVGTKAVNALSKEFLVRSHRGGEFVEAAFKAGKLKNEKNGKTPANRTAPSSVLCRTRRFSRRAQFRPEFVERRLRHYSYLNTGLKLHLQRPDFCLAQRPAGPGDGGFAADNAEPIYPPLHYSSKTLEFCFHAQQQPLRRDFFLVRQRPVHRLTAARI